ncbi:MAG TPA: ABC transporter substrate-binding protein [Paracoccus sp. (in: a-proteobacteria)]|uniref:ABC transporter substrate-binding protein n=1 Tax=uncultured Paracoccus sp. TaxID=189685 RepID=UPI00262D95D5|nr:ABC transporter substrate-binding protein [uncultured Paracoccus sp.]HMQ42448.1 ABC transporter substrate-binding protein [Paracoccus sp. (in: a-proteobacteria)]HMR37557.1 ABC transporter substrate-binding protein [Paracoccus sp. (in: a-proteobacteria)]
MKKIIASAALALAIGGSGMAAAQDGEDMTITLVPGLTTDAFYITMNRGAQVAADALGITVEFQGAEEFDPVLQTPVLDAVIGRGPDAILVAPTDSTQMIEPLRRASDAGIPVITVDTFIDDGKYQDGAGDGDFPFAYIASDNIGGGRMAARAMAEAIGGAGAVYVSNVRPGVSTTDQREEGFKAEMAENFPDIEVMETQYNENDASLAASQFQAVLARNPEIKGVFGANLFSALGAGNGVESAGKADEVTVIAFDAPASIVNNISSGLVDAAIAQHPAEIGYFGVMAAYAHLKGESIPTTIGTGFTVIDASNVDDEATQKFIYSE